MSITLGGITLPPDLEWTDELRWTPVEQSRERTVDGRQLIQEGSLTAGRPITLESNGAAWFSRSTLVALQATLTADNDLTFDYFGTQYTVRWRHADTPIEPDPVMRQRNPGDTHKYTATLRLVTV